MTVYSTILRLKGFPLKSARRKIDIHAEKKIEDRLLINEERKWHIFKYHLENTPGYQDLQTGEVKDWLDVPVIQKKNFQESKRSIVSTALSTSSIYEAMTSGSSGVALSYAFDKFSYAMVWADILRLYEMHGIDYGAALQARFFGAPETSSAKCKEWLKDVVARRVRFPVKRFSSKDMQEIVKIISRRKFIYLYGYTSALMLLAQHLNDNNIILSDVCPSLKCFVFTSEYCDVNDRNFMRENFGVKGINEYGASELGLIAFDDLQGSWCINDRLLDIEVVDDEGAPVPDGVVGRLLVTNLDNKAMPFIRYDLGDLGAITRQGEQRVISSFTGRIQEFLIYPNGQKAPGLLLYTSMKYVAMALGCIKEYRIRQVESDLLIVDVVASKYLSEEMKEVIAKGTNDFLSFPMRVEVNQVEWIERTALGKFKHFECLL